MQYPLRPSWRRYDFDECLKEIRVKPKSAQVEIDIQHGSSGQGEPHSWKQTLISSKSSPTITSHAIGVLKGNKLYVSSVNAFQQMRPKIEIADDGADKVMGVKVDRRGPKIPKDIIGKRPVASSKDQDKTISLDTQSICGCSWILLKYHSSSSKTSSNCLKKLMTAKHSGIPSTVKQCDYLNSFFLKKENDNRMQSLSQLPLEERFKKWLCKGDSQAFRFSALKCLAPEASAEEVIEILEKYAVLVQGLWVPKNSTIQLVSEATPRKALARDYVILKFSKKLKFTYQELDGYKSTMRSSLREALNGLGKDCEVLNSWKLKEPADPSFEKQYPSVAKQQKQLLEAHQPEIMSQMKNFRKNEKEGATSNARLPVEKQDRRLVEGFSLMDQQALHP